MSGYACSSLMVRSKFFAWKTWFVEYPVMVDPLTHRDRVMHICVSNLTIIGSDNGLSPVRRQAIIWTNAGILSIEPLGTNFSEILIRIQAFSFKKMHLKMSSAKWRPFCLGLNVLMGQKSICSDQVTLLRYGKLSSQYSQQTTHSLPMWVRCGVYLVSGLAYVLPLYVIAILLHGRYLIS